MVAMKDDGVGHPDRRDEDVDRPLELRVLLALGDAERQGDGGEHDHRLPAPEGEGREPAAEQAHVAGALHHVVRGREQGRAAEREDHRVGVQRAQPPVGEPRDVEVERRPRELGGDDHPDQHADDAPHDGHHRELAYDGVVVGLVHARQCSVTHPVRAAREARGAPRAPWRRGGAVAGLVPHGGAAARLRVSCPMAARRRNCGSRACRVRAPPRSPRDQLVKLGPNPELHSRTLMASSATRATRPNAITAEENRKPRSCGISIITGTPV